MSIQITRVFNDALTKTKVGFICEKVPTHREYVGIAQAKTYAEFVRSETFGNVTNNYYNERSLLATTLEIQNDFSRFLTRDFALKLGEIYRVEDKADKLNYIVSLLKNVVSDNEAAPLSVKDICICESPKQISSSDFTSSYKKESELYMHPVEAFNFPYENCWDTSFSFFRQKTVDLNGSSYPICKKANMNLRDILKDQNITPILKMLVKLWVLHQLATSFDKDELIKHPFFKADNIENVIANLQKSIIANINQQTQLSFQERTNIAKANNANNRFALSPVKYFLSQRLSFLKFIIGFSNEDIHTLRDQQLSLKTRSLFYLSTYLNFPLIKYILDIIKKDFLKTKSNFRNFVGSKSLFWSVLIHSLKLTRSTFLALWMPFLSAYFMLVGITSIPFSVSKKLLNISPGYTLDKIVTFGEALKDIALGIYISFMALEFLAFIETFTAGSFLIGVGTSIGFYSFWLCALPLSILILSDDWKYTYPGWFKDEFGNVTYREKSGYTRLTEGIAHITANRALSFHALFAGIIVVGYSAVALSALLFNKAYSKIVVDKQSKKADASSLRQIVRNLNHSQNFIKLCAQLASKLEQGGACDDNEESILTALGKCYLSEQNRAALKVHFQSCMADPKIESKNVYRLALADIDSPTFIPSWKLIQQVEKDLQAKKTSTLKSQIHDIHEVYQRELQVAM